MKNIFSVTHIAYKYNMLRSNISFFKFVVLVAQVISFNAHIVVTQIKQEKFYCYIGLGCRPNRIHIHSFIPFYFRPLAHKQKKNTKDTE